MTNYNSAFSPAKIDNFSKIKFLKIEQDIHVQASCYTIDYEVLKIDDPYSHGFVMKHVVK